MSKAKTKPHCAIVLCHPRAKSFCAALAERVRASAEKAGYSTIVRDLYSIGFDPILHARDIALNLGGNRPAPDVEQEIQLLGKPQVIVIVYPIWFGSPPGLLKGYIERVLGAGFGGPGTVPLAAGPRPRLLLTIATSGASKEWIDRKGIAASAGRLFGAYLAGALDIPRAEHIAIDNVIPTMSAVRAGPAIAKVEEGVRKALALPKPAPRKVKGEWNTLPDPTESEEWIAPTAAKRSRPSTAAA